MGISEKAFEIPPMYQNDEEVYASFNEFISRLEEVKLTDRLRNIFAEHLIYIIQQRFILMPDIIQMCQVMCMAVGA